MHQVVWLSLIMLLSGRQTRSDPVDLTDVQEKLFHKLFMSKYSSSLVTFPHCFRGERAKFANYTEYMAALKQNNMSALDVGVEISLAEIGNVNEREQSVMLKLYCWIEWSDCRLKWSLDEFPLEQISLRLEAANSITFYTPLISLLREITPHFSHLADTEIKLHHDGKVNIYKEYVTSIGCTIDIHPYPFDTHICDITFEAAESRRIVNITYHQMGFDNDPLAIEEITAIHTAALLKSDAWDVVAPKSHLSERIIDNCLRDNGDADLCAFRQITHKVIIRRNPTYQLLHLVVPTAVTMILSGVIFLTSPDVDKINLSITILFVLTMYVQIMYSKMPETGETALLSQYYLFCIGLESFSCLAAVFSGVVVHSAAPMSRFLTQFIELLGPIVVTSYYKHRAILRHNNGRPAPSNCGLAMGIGLIANEIELAKVDWHLAAALFDRCYFVFHSLLSVISLFVFLGRGFFVWKNYGYLLTDEDWLYVEH